jgi:membrane fusion protein (multidrug efflux system)
MLSRTQSANPWWLLLALPACSGGAPNEVALPPPAVGVAEVLTAEVSGERRFVGTLSAVQRVELRARVQGTIESKFFIDGQDVREGQRLFQIDPRSPRAALAQARAGLADANAELVKATADARRSRDLFEASNISQAELEAAVARERTARAAVAANRAMVENAALTTEFTEIVAPFNGQVGAASVDVGSLVGPTASSPLTTVVRLDPIYAEFSIGERDYLRMQQIEKTERTPVDDLMVALELADGTLYPLRGRLVFISPELDPGTGSFLIRGLFPNPARVLRPGQFAKVVIRSDRPEPRTLVPEEALVTRQEGEFVYVVDADDAAERRRVVPGDPRGSLRIIESGLEAGERVVALGVHKVREGSKVNVTKTVTLDLSSDPLSTAPPKHYPGDWAGPFAGTLGARTDEQEKTTSSRKD